MICSRAPRRDCTVTPVSQQGFPRTQNLANLHFLTTSDAHARYKGCPAPVALKHADSANPAGRACLCRWLGLCVCTVRRETQRERERGKHGADIHIEQKPEAWSPGLIWCVRSLVIV